jgi:hypothetical protein
LKVWAALDENDFLLLPMGEFEYKTHFSPTMLPISEELAKSAAGMAWETSVEPKTGFGCAMELGKKR